jgi:outer membrane receptor protein involved in Fe transport
MMRVTVGLLSSASLSVLAAAAPSIAVAQEPVVAVAIPAGPMQKSLVALASQANFKILFEPELVAGLQAPALNGRYTPREAVERLLSGTNVAVDQIRPGVLVLRRLRAPVSTLGGDGYATTAGPDQAAPPSPDADPVLVEEVIVGSHIRGAKDAASPVVTIARDAIDRGGFASIGDALAALPQTFSGTASNRAGGVGADTTGNNAGRSTGVNLRGLGADATLVLVNGRRVAGAGLMADFADISSLPLSAVDRVDVLLDGASAVYGSDAVGGVVNIVMRDHWVGMETRARIGGATQGGLGQRKLAQTFGTAWTSGSLLLSAEYQRTNQVMGRDRAYTANADLRSFGGADHRLFYSQPGNILIANAPAYAIPGGQNGTALTPASFLAGQVNYQNQNEVAGILPQQERTALYASATQDVGSRVSLNVEARLSDRRYAHWNLAPIAAMTVTRANPYFVSPNGAASNSVAYSMQNETGASRGLGRVRSSNIALGAKVDLPADWRLDVYAGHGEELTRGGSSGLINSAALNEALGNTADSPLSAYSAPRDGYFNPYIGQGRNAQAVLDFVVSGWDRRRTLSNLDIANATADGTLFTLPAGAVRLAVGAQARREFLKMYGVSTSSSLTPIPIAPRRGERTVHAVFGEARIPIFGGDFQRPGFSKLELSAAVRWEDYGGGVDSTVPKFGLAWAPVEDLTLRATYGESFRAPSIGQLTDAPSATPVNLSNGVRPVLTLILIGGNRNLAPETAKSWTGGFEYAPLRHPELKLSGTLFRTAFEGRIGRPAINYLSTILTASDLAPFRTLIAPATNAADLALVKSYLANASAAAQALYPAEAYGAIGDARYVNAGAFTVEGVDLTGAYRLDVGEDRVDFSGNLSWLMHYKRKITSASSSVELAGMAGFPADLRARASATWTHRAFATTLALNHIGDLHTDTGRRMKPLTTADVQVRWAPSATAGVWRGAAVSLTVQNLFDQDPPFYDAPQIVGFDAANYDPSGRVIALQLTKAW